MNWIIPIVYVSGFLFFWRSLVMGVLESIERDFPDVPLDGGDRLVGVFVGTILALIWPASMSVRMMMRRGFGKLQTPNEIRKAEQAELEAYRKLVRQHNFPAPDPEES